MKRLNDKANEVSGPKVDRLEAILARCEAATPGDINDDDLECISPSEVALLESARADLPIVVNALKKAVKALEVAREEICIEGCDCTVKEALAEIASMLSVGEK